jgi:hypothetical protein
MVGKDQSSGGNMRFILALSAFLVGSLLLSSYDVSIASARGFDLNLKAPLVVPADQQGIHWGNFQQDKCTQPGKRQYSAILWGIPWGQSWETACANTPADIQGHHFERPSRCVNTTANMWGEFDVPDGTCLAQWKPSKPDQCTGIGVRQYSAQLIVPDGVSWEAACLATAATIQGQAFAKPTRCVNQGVFGMWGEFDIEDTSCVAEWKSFKPDKCVATGVRQYSAQLNVPTGASWEAACEGTGATIQGQAFAKPDRCKNEGVGGMWGEFDVKDDSCLPKWNPFKADKCVAVGVRQYSAQLLVPDGLAWETCEGIGATIQGQVFAKPDRCKNVGVGGMWGEFDVKDDSCLPAWNPFKADKCVAVGVRQYSAQLNVPDGLSWEASCVVTGASIQRQVFAKPNRCKNEGLGGMWGEFDIKDDSCLPAWNPFKEDQCIGLERRQYSAQLIVPDGLSWEASCVATGASIEGQAFAKPTRCKNVGLAGMWGEFDVTDTSCRPRWGEFKRDRCTGTWTRQYSAILWEIPRTLSWERTCGLTGATVAGQVFSKPSRCVNTNLNEWGEFDVTDRLCAIEYPLTQMSWQTIVAIVVALLVVLVLVVLWARFFPRRRTEHQA